MWSTPRKNTDRAALGLAWLALFAAAGFALVTTGTDARAESAYCNDLRVQIANAGADGRATRDRAAAAKQQNEYGQLAAQAQSMGCNREQFLFFGSAPRAQCGPINARLAALRANIATLTGSGANNDSLRQALAARYDAECRNRHIITARPRGPRNFFEELFGVAPDENSGLQEVPVEPSESDRQLTEGDMFGDRPHGGSVAICVRDCDGGFFPISYSARSSNLDELSSLCKALCPNAEATLYTRSLSGDIESAVSIDGVAYSEHPNALKYQKSYDPACGCKPPGQSWADALAEAERILAASNTKDVVVSAEQAERMSRPIAPGENRGKNGAKPLSTRQDALAPAESTAPVNAGEGVNSDQNATRAPETFRDVVGPDGVKRRVRVVAPTL